MPISRKMLLAIAPDLYQELEELTANGLQQMFANIDTPFLDPILHQNILSI